MERAKPAVVRSSEGGLASEKRTPYRWRHIKTQAMHTRTVTGVQFLRLVLQHVLPKGLRRARSYGFLHPNCKRGIALRRLLALRRRAKAPMVPVDTAMGTERPKLVCRCGALMHVVRRRILPSAMVAASLPPTCEGAPQR